MLDLRRYCGADPAAADLAARKAAVAAALGTNPQASDRSGSARFKLNPHAVAEIRRELETGRVIPRATRRRGASGRRRTG